MPRRRNCPTGPARAACRQPGGGDRRCLRSRTWWWPTAASTRSRASRFDVGKGQVVTLLGTNGAGKSTTLRSISGLLKPVSGEIWFEGERLDGLPAHKVVERGIAQSPEGRRLFRQMTVEDNLKLGAYSRKDTVRREVRHGPGLRPVPRARRTPDGAGRPVLRRRAADAGHRPGHDEPAQAADAGRAVDGPEPDHDPDDHADHQGAAGRRASRSCWSSRTRRRRCRSPTRATCSRSGQIMFSDTGRNLLGDDRVRRTYLGAD